MWLQTSSNTASLHQNICPFSACPIQNILYCIHLSGIDHIQSQFAAISYPFGICLYRNNRLHPGIL